MTAESTDVSVDELSETVEEVAPTDLDVDRSRWDRIATTALGGTLLALGLRRRSLVGTAVAAAGGWLCYRGLRGTETISRALETTREGRLEGGTETEVELDRDELDARVPVDRPGVARSITVGRPADELVELWRDPDSLSQIVGVAEVHSVDEDRLRWTVEGPLGWGLSWDTTVVEVRSDELLHWRTLEDRPLSFEGTVRFRPAPADRGTEVTLELRVESPGGPVGDAVLEYLDVVPDALVGTMLDRFKSLAETGDVPTTDRNPSARGKGDLV